MHRARENIAHIMRDKQVHRLSSRRDKIRDNYIRDKVACKIEISMCEMYLLCVSHWQGWIYFLYYIIYRLPIKFTANSKLKHYLITTCLKLKKVGERMYNFVRTKSAITFFSLVSVNDIDLQRTLSLILSSQLCLHLEKKGHNRDFGLYNCAPIILHRTNTPQARDKRVNCVCHIIRANISQTW